MCASPPLATDSCAGVLVPQIRESSRVSCSFRSPSSDLRLSLLRRAGLARCFSAPGLIPQRTAKICVTFIWWHSGTGVPVGCWTSARDSRHRSRRYRSLVSTRVYAPALLGTRLARAACDSRGGCNGIYPTSKHSARRWRSQACGNTAGYWVAWSRSRTR